MSIVVISPFDSIPGEGMRPGRFTHLCESLVELNETVIWLTTDYSHFSKRKRTVDQSSLKHYKIILVKTIPYKSNISISRLVSHLFFGLSVFYWLLKINHSGRIKGIICANPPVMVNLLTSLFCSAYRIPGICDINDVWPEAFSRFLPDSFAIRVFFKISIKIRKLMFKGYSAVTAVSNDYIKIVSNSIPLHTPTMSFPLGHDFDEFAEQLDLKWNNYSKQVGKIWAIYVGTISKNYDLITIIESAISFPEVMFFFVGSGEDFEYFSQYAKQISADNITFTGFLPYKDMCNLLNICDFGLLSVNNKAFIRFPNKAFDYFAAGLNVLSNISEGEVSEFLKNKNIGGSYIEGSSESFKKCLRDQINSRNLKQQEIIQVTKSNYDSKYIYKNFARWSQRIIEERNAN